MFLRFLSDYQKIKIMSSKTKSKIRSLDRHWVINFGAKNLAVLYISFVNELILNETLKKITTDCSYPCRPNITSNGKTLDKIIGTLPLCRSENELHCFDEIISEAGEVILKEPCTKLQYRVEGSTYPNIFKSNKAIFSFQFGSRAVRVKEQYIVYDAVAMISAIGGTMGLCIGFSFNDTINFLLSYLEVGINCWKRLRQRNSKKTIQEKINMANPNEGSNEIVSKLSDHESDHEIRISAIEKILNLANK